MSEHGDRLSREQREALWKWRWLGFRNGTPAFKGSLVVLGIVAAYVVVRFVTL